MCLDSLDTRDSSCCGVTVSENLYCRSRSGVTIAHLIFSEIGLGMQKTKVSAAMRERLLRSARKVMKNAYAPFSNFRVGAAILTSKGQVFVGCNVENSSYGMTNCAERTAIFLRSRSSDRNLKFTPSLSPTTMECHARPAAHAVR